MTRNALGRGLSALIRESESPTADLPNPSHVAGTSGAAAAVAPARIPDPSAGVLQIDIDLIEPSPYQPRTRFAEAALEELAQSIRATGILQPLVVRRRGQRYELLAGERRWRAAQLIPLPRVPALLQQVSDQKALEITLVENLQREDLNPIEEAHAFDRLIREFELTQEQAAERTGKDRATVANALRLLRLDKTIRQMLEQGQITAGHARALLAIEDEAFRLALARRASRGNMTVRHIERFATRTRRPKAAQVPTPTLDANTRAAVEELERVLGTRVSLTPCLPHKPGQLSIEYYNDSDLHRIYQFIVSR